MDSNANNNEQQEKLNVFINEVEQVIGKDQLGTIPESIIFEYDFLPDLTRWWNG